MVWVSRRDSVQDLKDYFKYACGRRRNFRIFRTSPPFSTNPTSSLLPTQVATPKRVTSCTDSPLTYEATSNSSSQFSFPTLWLEVKKFESFNSMPCKFYSFNINIIEISCLFHGWLGKVWPPISLSSLMYVVMHQFWVNGKSFRDSFSFRKSPLV